jgi:soluble lytic murein transglycosylase-like protein
MLYKITTMSFFLFLYCLTIFAAGTSGDSALFSIDLSGTGALRNGTYRQALNELRQKSVVSDSAAYSFKLMAACVRAGDTAGARSSMTTTLLNDSTFGPLAWTMRGDLLLAKNPDSALVCYGRALAATLPAKYRNALFDKINSAVGNDTQEVASAPFWAEYAKWWNVHRGAPPDTFCARIDTLLSGGDWPRIDTFVNQSLPALRDSVQCVIVKAIAGSAGADSALSAAGLFLAGRVAMENGMYGIAERLLAASRKKTDFSVRISERAYLLFRGKLSFAERQYTEAINALGGYIKRFGYESDIGLLIARAYKNLDRDREAAVWYDRFIAHTPRYGALSEILWRRAWMEEEQGRPLSAVNFYRRICKSFPRSSRADESWVRRALCYYRVEKYDSAFCLLASFEKIGGDSPLLPAARYWKAKCLLGLDKIDSAKARFAELSRREPADYYAQRARDLLALLGDSLAARLSLDTAADNNRAVAWLDSVSPPTQKPLAADDSLNLRRGLLCAAVGFLDEAEMFLEPAELSYPGNLSLNFRIAAFYRSVGALMQAARSGRRLAWRIPAANRERIPLPVYLLMYPCYYDATIKSEAQKRNVDPSFVRAVIRQESVFNAGVMSPAGAIGLMQIMPATGAALARELGEPWSVDTLYRAAANIRYGTFYLRKLLNQFTENEVLALASYNGGPPNAREWYSRNRDKDFDLFVEDIDFSETRNYVKKVLGNYWFYRKLTNNNK